MLSEFHVLALLLLFVWHALTAYAATPEGEAELLALEEAAFPAEPPTATPSGSTPTPPMGATGSSVRSQSAGD